MSGMSTPDNHTSVSLNAELGRVESAKVCLEDHGILTFWVQMDFGGAVQGFGGVMLDTYDERKKRRVGTAAGCDLLLRLLSFFKVDEISEAEGATAYALREERYGPIVGLRRCPFDGGGELLLDDWRKEWGLGG